MNMGGRPPTSRRFVSCYEALRLTPRIASQSLFSQRESLLKFRVSAEHPFRRRRGWKRYEQHYTLSPVEYPTLYKRALKSYANAARIVAHIVPFNPASYRLPGLFPAVSSAVRSQPATTQAPLYGGGLSMSNLVCHLRSRESAGDLCCDDLRQQ